MAEFRGRCGFSAPWDDWICDCPEQPSKYRQEIFCGKVSADWHINPDIKYNNKRSLERRLGPGPGANAIKPFTVRSTHPQERAIAAIGKKVSTATAIILNNKDDAVKGAMVLGLSGVLDNDITYEGANFRKGGAWVIRWDFSWYIGYSPNMMSDFASEYHQELPASGILGPFVRLTLQDGVDGHNRKDFDIYFPDNSMFNTAQQQGDLFFEKILVPMSKEVTYQGPDLGFGSTRQPELKLADFWQKQYTDLSPEARSNMTRDEGWTP